MKVLEKCLFCNILYAIKWGINRERKGSGSSFLSVSLSIQITNKLYPSLFLNILPDHSLSIPIATVFIQAAIIIGLDFYCSLLTELLLSVWPPRVTLPKKSHQWMALPANAWSSITPLPFSVPFLHHISFFLLLQLDLLLRYAILSSWSTSTPYLMFQSRSTQENGNHCSFRQKVSKGNWSHRWLKNWESK